LIRFEKEAKANFLLALSPRLSPKKLIKIFHDRENIATMAPHPDVGHGTFRQKQFRKKKNGKCARRQHVDAS
jgi:hypothetical protein